MSVCVPVITNDGAALSWTQHPAAFVRTEGGVLSILCQCLSSLGVQAGITETSRLMIPFERR